MEGITGPLGPQGFVRLDTDFSLDNETKGTACGVVFTWNSQLRLWHFDDLPHHFKDNEFVKSCYRCHMSVGQALKSIFHIHCETGNIWTHLLGAIGFMVLASVVLSDSTLSFNSRLSLMCFFIGSTSCLLCSALYHTLYVVSPEMQTSWGKVDYLGIILGIWGGEAGTILALFSCDHHKQHALLGVLTTLGVISLACVMLKVFQSPQFRIIRTTVFVLFGLSGILPFAIFGFEHADCWDDPECAPLMSQVFVSIVWTGIIFVGGAVLYASCVPERFFPGKFDILGHSHQIWHIAVILGYLCNYAAVRAGLDFFNLPANSCASHELLSPP